MEKYWNNLRSCLGELKPYVAGKGIGEIAKGYGFAPEKIVKLGSNENPYGPSPRVWEAMTGTRLERYPETDDLMESLAGYAGASPEDVVIGTGMDGVMDTLTRLFLDPGDRTLIFTPTFSYYEILIRLCGAEPVFSARGPQFEADIDIPDDLKLIFICSPNNPTGNEIPENDLRAIVETTDAVVFLDEAYAEFGDQSFLGLVGEYENLVVGRTFSKAFGLAGLRLGYAVAPRWIVDEYRKVAPPFFGVASPAVAAGTAALDDQEHMRRAVSKIKRERDQLQREIPESHPSGGNFLYIETEEKSGLVAEKMLDRGVIIRDCASFRDSGEHHIRVTVGIPEEMQTFLQAYREIC